MSHVDSLEARLLQFIRRDDAPSEEEFCALALALFAQQFATNAPYRAYAHLIGRTPEAVTSWRDIPAVPTSAFKLPLHPLTCGGEPEVTFLTSGTTTDVRGAHHLPDTTFYREAISQAWPFAPPLLPSFFLAPSAQEAPESSLAFMFAHLNQLADGDDARFLLRDSKFHLAPLFAHVATGKPLFLMGTALAFLHLMEMHGPISLPPGSRLLETGGYKGTSHSLSKPDFYRDLSTFFDLPADHLHNEYGMTELSSQAYATGAQGRHRFPHWCRVIILDPETETEVPVGQMGYLVIHDLANLHSVATVRTQDFAIRHSDESFTLIGRDPGALPRGCSRTIDHALSS